MRIYYLLLLYLPMKHSLLCKVRLPQLPYAYIFIDSEYLEDEIPTFYGNPGTQACMLELILTTIRNLEINNKGEFTPELVGGSTGFIDSYFKGQTSESYASLFCNYTLPVPMKSIITEIKSAQGESKLLQTLVSHRAQNENTAPVYTSLQQRYLIVKLNFSEVELAQEDIKALWNSVEEKFDTSLLTSPSTEEHKGGNNNAELVATVDRLNKPWDTSNNEVNILIDGKWRNFKTDIYKSNVFANIKED